MRLLFFVFGHLFWSGMWFGVAPRLDPRRVSCVSKRLDMCSKCDDQSRFNNQSGRIFFYGRVMRL